MEYRISSTMSPTMRFSDVVENYIRYRPGYPKEVISVLNKKIGLTPNRIIADIGSGTGKSAELFLQNKNIVFGVEPNDAMRQAAEVQFINLLNFRSIKGSAEETTLSANSMDIVVAGQAFHWFDAKKAKKEFKRILKSNGWIVLIWNERNNHSPFLSDYEKFLLNNSIDYTDVDHKNIDHHALRNFYGTMSFGCEELPYAQHFDLDGLKGRYLSCSYAYKENHPLFEIAMKDLQEVYEKFEDDGLVTMDYITKIYFGQLAT